MALIYIDNSKKIYIVMPLYNTNHMMHMDEMYYTSTATTATPLTSTIEASITTSVAPVTVTTTRKEDATIFNNRRYATTIPGPTMAHLATPSYNTNIPYHATPYHDLPL